MEQIHQPQSPSQSDDGLSTTGELMTNEFTTEFNRRGLLSHFSAGFAGIALADMLGRENVWADSPSRSPHFAPRARRAVHIFLGGGLSQVDSFDYKPELIKRHGQAMPTSGELDTFSGKVGLLHKPHWKFQQRGSSGLWVSELFPEIAQIADQLTVIRSMVADNANHIPATYQAQTGFRNLGFPSVGSWISFGLGNESDNLPTFVVLPDARGVAHGGPNLWSNAFLPAHHQGVAFGPGPQPIANLTSARPIDAATGEAQLAFLHRMNQRHLADRTQTDALAGRIRAYELAAKMQVSIPEANDLASESQSTQQLYGLDRPACAEFGRSCLLTRRLLERGVRFVQLWSGTGVSWDGHSDLPGKEHGHEAQRIDRPVAGFLRDLQMRGMLDDTLLIFSTEFGRTPFAESAGKSIGKGRDHNQHAFSCWLAGAGLKPGIAYGTTDDFGYAAVENPVTVHDFHATILQLLGIDHERLTYAHNGVDRRLTNVHGHVLHDIIGDSAPS